MASVSAIQTEIRVWSIEPSMSGSSAACGWARRRIRGSRRIVAGPLSAASGGVTTAPNCRDEAEDDWPPLVARQPLLIARARPPSPGHLEISAIRLVDLADIDTRRLFRRIAPGALRPVDAHMRT